MSKTTRFAAICLLASLAATPVLAVSMEPNAPDNTQVNTRDRSNDEPTADDARQSTSDVDAMQKIRKAVVNDGSLSTYGHNIKIIAQGGKVTLKGPVNSQDESQRIEAEATQIVGNGNVTNRLSVMGADAAKARE